MIFNYSNYLEIIRLICFIILGGISIYLSSSVKAQKKAKEVETTIANIAAKAVIYIKEAEEDYKDLTNSGGTKFTQVVDKLYDLVPSALKMIVTREMIETIVQSTFDEIEEYAKLQLDKAVDSIKIEEKE